MKPLPTSKPNCCPAKGRYRCMDLLQYQLCKPLYLPTMVRCNLLTIRVRRQRVSACDRGSRAAWKSHTFIALWEREWERWAWLTTCVCEYDPMYHYISLAYHINDWCHVKFVLHSVILAQVSLCTNYHTVGLRVCHIVTKIYNSPQKF